MAEINIIAIPDSRANLGGNNLSTARRNMAQRASNAGYQFINNFQDTGDLIAKAKAILDQDPSHCLKRLEIVAHGNPETHDGIGPLTLSGFIGRYRNLKDQLCDETHILLTGCNTGLQMRARSGLQDSLAQRIAQALPFDPNNFNIHLSVWGLAGYGLQGTTAMERNKEVRARYYYRGRRYHPYPGARDATGRNSWNHFNNW